MPSSGSASKLFSNFTYLDFHSATLCMRPEFMAFVSSDSVCCILWHGLEQSVIDDAVDLWPIRSCVCVHANGGHFEHTV